MYRFIESIRYQQGVLYNLPYHQERVNRTMKKFWPKSPTHSLAAVIADLPVDLALYKCRVMYHRDNIEYGFERYHKKKIKSLKIVRDVEIEYAYKAANRDHLTAIYQKRGSADDIIIVKNGIVTDSYFANLAFLKNGLWYTPKSPLLAGIRRQCLMEQKKLLPTIIKEEDIEWYEGVSLINAMLSLGEIRVRPENIIS